MEALFETLSQLDPIWVYASVGCIAFIENIFPPFPSDVVVVAAGSLAAGGRVDAVTLTLSATVGSTLGFLAMYRIGGWIGSHILETGRFKFIPVDQVTKVENWFRHYGYWVVVANRFLAGTRAVVSFFAGMSDLSLTTCVLLSFFSALAWNAILVTSGDALGTNWREIGDYLAAYGRTVTIVVVLFFAGYLLYRFYLRRSSTNSNGPANPQ
ncbi:MAG: hypothetical protein A3H45_07310 [Ignavibacteria bacterium RIFCSPLOWO2_02_FULL_55_14]|nr:MAG: hypothetical protein A2X68_05610 [Ignavibacteria bacterium GWC2_56_12]OGU67482.1 MAG: hypothetical protein A3C56_12155 [Ignavibacteria bacterium RIFCSPHIGHO2_02_FULL_56_12]OGU72688.1 MAG: hypothetical protein A3H45_07310 [Ignavibacteria bacterium RIFCSPLOWO2_02_FULL_55_14]OGU73452.1 MAG: hypothetical protein A3G43_05215 [Ignavibacteria bacterium RIFCSPLOWO2_12_FULL_56_21]